ncbi:MAG: trypsin-like peptidase domain-containing protein [Planctomycetota bacterium]|nr:trypsin-like peptidase domain-containing protein [Planctomycetota bacterium]MEC8512427.1 trypsin-like peptidase domain-containing protein [Planctomycetota bacterium]
MDRPQRTTALLLALAAPTLAVAALPETAAAPVGPAPPTLTPAEPDAHAIALAAQREEAERERLYDELAKEPRETAVSRIVRTVTPAVVFVETEAYQRVRTILGTRKRVATGAGSGVVIHPSGLIVTNYHVVEGAQNIRVSFEGEPESYVAELMSFVREEDLALLKIRRDEDRAAAGPAGTEGGGLRKARTPREFPTVRLGTSADLMPGERVVAIGSPHGQAYTVSTGIISGLHRDVSVPNRNLSFRGLIQTDASINLGNSGGPLLNIRGELIGINTVMNSAAENIGFAIPVDRVSQVLDEVLFPNARTIWLGFDVKEIGSKLIVTEVWQGGPAEHLNACEGSELVALNGAAVRSEEDFLLETLRVQPGDETRVTLVDGDGRFETTIVPWDEFNGRFYTDIGMKVSVERPNGESGTVLMVEAVREGSAAHDLGVLPGDIIPAVRPRIGFNTNSFWLVDKRSLETLLDQVPPGTEIEIDAYRDLNGDGFYKRPEQLKGVLIR